MKKMIESLTEENQSLTEENQSLKKEKENLKSKKSTKPSLQMNLDNKKEEILDNSLLGLYLQKEASFDINDYNQVLLNNIDDKLVELFTNIQEVWCDNIHLENYKTSFINNSFYVSDKSYANITRNEYIKNQSYQTIENINNKESLEYLQFFLLYLLEILSFEDLESEGIRELTEYIHKKLFEISTKLLYDSIKHEEDSPDKVENNIKPLCSDEQGNNILQREI